MTFAIESYLDRVGGAAQRVRTTTYARLTTDLKRFFAALESDGSAAQTIRELAEELLAQFEAHPLRHEFPPFAGFREVESKSFYGDGYQDVAHRKPSVENARRLIDWQPSTAMAATVGKTLDFFLREAMAQREA